MNLLKAGSKDKALIGSLKSHFDQKLIDENAWCRRFQTRFPNNDKKQALEIQFSAVTTLYYQPSFKLEKKWFSQINVDICADVFHALLEVFLRIPDE